MRLLLDTHAFFGWIFDDPRLSSSASTLIAAPLAEILFIVANAWEIATKSRTGRLDLPPHVPVFIHDQIPRNRFTVLPIALRHALQVHALPDHHRDPFDRLLAAQAQVEAVPLLSTDAQIATYDVTLRW